MDIQGPAVEGEDFHARLLVDGVPDLFPGVRRSAETVFRTDDQGYIDPLLQELTLDYNKGRQQKITSEILDIVGGSLK